MLKPNIKSTETVVPMIYAYTTPEVVRHNGWTKIGYTERDVEKRIKEQAQTIDVEVNLEWKGNAIYDDGSGDSFTDKEFHSYLRKNGVEQETGKNNEWFHINGPDSKQKFYEFRSNRGILKSCFSVIPYILRAEQEEAVKKTLLYRNSHEKGEFLWNAKPRFGKTLAVYDFCKRIEAETVLIVTNRPAIANSWYSDYMQFVGIDSNYYFVSEVDALKGKPNVLSREEYQNVLLNFKDDTKLIEFVSLQDLKGSMYFGGHYDKLRELSNRKDEKGNRIGVEWDILVIDEAHEGVDTYRTDVAFDHIDRKFTLHLSGTPFKALANNKFSDDAIYNWTYADEQKMRQLWDSSNERENPYEALPRLNLFTYQMSEIIKDEINRGIEINGETEEYAFDLNEFFATNGNGIFVHDSSVDKFLDALTKLEKYPFSTPELRSELKHTFWLLNRVDSAKALAKKLKDHPVFKDYEIILAAGDGKIDDADETKKSFDKVKAAIANNDKTITLSVGQLTTGVTIPEWTGVLMLSNVGSPSLYMQAAFRAQNPCLFKVGSGYERKENSYVFDFDPARTLIIFEQFANDLSEKTVAGRGDVETRKNNIRELLNFFPVIGEDENGELIELDAEKVLTIPRKIKSLEVVRRGFMSNFLFQNITSIFSAPQVVKQILEKMEPVSEPKGKVNLSAEVKKDLSLDENGEVSLTEEEIHDTVERIFGEKIFNVKEELENAVVEVNTNNDDLLSQRLKEIVKQQVVKEIVEATKDDFGSDMKTSDTRLIESKLNSDADRLVDKTVLEFNTDKKLMEKARSEALQSRFETGRTTEEINQEYDKKQEEITAKFTEELTSVVKEFTEKSKEETAKTIKTRVNERERDTIEDGVRDHLRGFARTIPSFLMAYGDDTVTLSTFDITIPGKVFEEVTSITLEQFRFLRDGGTYIDENTGEEKIFNGHLFDQVVFDDSVKEFLSLKKRLADYFDEKSIEDIFDYIPPQKTNQIFTPKDVVKNMVDLLEKENPGCFDDPDRTFIDLYMKSGLYITEIVKRLYQSEKMKEIFPDDKERLRHIFKKQVYGLAPTEIIYKIATSFILGFEEEISIEDHNFRQVDALPFAKEGTLQQKLDELFD